MQDIQKAAEGGESMQLKKNDKVFKMIPGIIGEGEMASTVLYFVDVTSFENLKDMYNDDKACIAVVSVDNFDELTSSEGEDREMEISTEIDKLLRCWAGGDRSSAHQIQGAYVLCGPFAEEPASAHR